MARATWQVLALGALLGAVVGPATAQVVIGDSKQPSVEVNWDVLDRLGHQPTLADMFKKDMAPSVARERVAPPPAKPVAFQPYGRADAKQSAQKKSVVTLTPPHSKQTAKAAPAHAASKAAPRTPPHVRPASVAVERNMQEPRPERSVRAKPAAIEAPRPVPAIEPPAQPMAVSPPRAVPEPAKPMQVEPAKPAPVELPKAAAKVEAPKAVVEAPRPAPVEPAPASVADEPAAKPLQIAPPAQVVKPAPQVASLPPAAAVRSHGDTLTLLFGADSAKLPDAALPELDRLAKRMIADENMGLQLMAYAEGDEANASKARRMSLTRAMEVRKYLVDRGVHPTHVEVRALGNKSNGGAADRVDAVAVPR